VDIKKAPKKRSVFNNKILISITIVMVVLLLMLKLKNSLATRTLERKDILMTSVKQGDLDVTVDGYGTLKSDKLQLLTTLTKATVK